MNMFCITPNLSCFQWTFCLGSVMVMGASGWFFLLTEENRDVTYVPAVLSGCGTSIMFVTTLALAAEFVDADRVRAISLYDNCKSIYRVPI